MLGAACSLAVALLGACAPGDAPPSGEVGGGGTPPGDVAFENHPGLQEFYNASGFRWETLTGGRFRVSFTPGGYAALVAPDFQDGAEGIMDELLEVLGEPEAPGGVHVFLVDSRERMYELAGRRDPAWWSEELGAVFLVFNEQDRPLLRRTLAPLVTERLWGNADPWLETGFGLWFDGECMGVERPLGTLPAMLEAEGRRVDARALVERWDEVERDDPFAAEMSAAGLTEYLVEQVGMTGIQRLWREGSGAVLALTGRDLDALDAAWRAWLPPVPADAPPLAQVEAEGGCR